MTQFLVQLHMYGEPYTLGSIDELPVQFMSGRLTM